MDLALKSSSNVANLENKNKNNRRRQRKNNIARNNRPLIMPAISSKDVTSAFEDLGFDLEDPKVIDMLTYLCDIYQMNAEKISTEVMAFMYRKKKSSTTDSTQVTLAPTIPILTEFEEDMKKHHSRMEEETGRKITDVTNLYVNESSCEVNDESDLLSAYGVKATPKRQHTPENGANKRKALFDGTVAPCSPVSTNLNQDPQVTPSSRKYQNRKNAGTTLISFGPKISNQWQMDPKTFKANIQNAHDHNSLTEPYTFMFEGLRDKAGYLDEIICRTTDILTAKYELDEVSDFTNTITNSFTCSGRICCDSSDGRLNSHSIVLQGTQDTCMGKALPFDASRVDEYSLFPGQIIMAEAMNPNGTKVVASKVYADASVSLSKGQGRVNKEPLSLVVCSGPYTTSDNLKYEPLRDFLKYVQVNRPHVAILIGPIVDEKHPLIESGDLNESYDNLFARIIKLISEGVMDVTTQIIVVSSSKDVSHIPIYPTPPYPQSYNGLAIPDNVKMVSDPCMVDIEGLLFGVTATDILFQLGKEEISFPPSSKDRLRRLSNHIIQQRSFYPLYPPSEDVNIDVSHLEFHATLKVQPHVLILPSDFMHFFKDINGGIVMNPNRLAKSESGGVFARILIHPAKSDQENDNSNFSNRFQAEIVRI